MKMNLPNKLTFLRIFLTIAILVLIGVNWSQFNISWPVYLLGGKVVIRLNYIISAVIFIIASITDMLDGKIARKRKQVTDFGKTMDAIADKVLVNSILVVLAYNHDIALIVPIVIIIRDTVVDSIKMISAGKGKVVAASLAGKIKTAMMMVGLTLVLIENIPMEFFGIALDQFIVLIATVLSIYSGIEYFLVNKDFIFNDDKVEKL
ncbi:MAG: CDP-diacylglycerol--glycerol-3-phosphate 3-phosphatidyltransferase [Bacilli bacterium]|nr:CDP-diacylglycerol--glycerol-3-phosphate 3-phosphatidyltransferase [Bacilli bacterium]